MYIFPLRDIFNMSRLFTFLQYQIISLWIVFMQQRIKQSTVIQNGLNKITIGPATLVE